MGGAEDRPECLPAIQRIDPGSIRPGSRRSVVRQTPDRPRIAGEKTRYRMNRPEVRATISERTRVALADPIVRTRHRAGIERAFADPALRQRISDRTKAGILAKLERQLAELTEVWEKTPKKVRDRFLKSLTRSG